MCQILRQQQHVGLNTFVVWYMFSIWEWAERIRCENLEGRQQSNL